MCRHHHINNPVLGWPQKFPLQKTVWTLEDLFFFLDSSDLDRFGSYRESHPRVDRSVRLETASLLSVSPDIRQATAPPERGFCPIDDLPQWRLAPRHFVLRLSRLVLTSIYGVLITTPFFYYRFIID